MSSRNTFMFYILVCFVALAMSTNASAQTGQYKKAKEAPAKEESKKESGGKADDKKSKDKSKEKETDKLDISDLEQKYWAPKDTDFSVVQNRTYTKAGRIGVSLMTGPVVNDAFSEGLSLGVRANYYLDERYGFELTYISSDLKDNDVTRDFANFSLGGIRPDFNRDDGYIGVGFNWVPIYAKVSLLGSKILYFDLQITPHIGMSSYAQQADASTGKNENIESSFSYGIDVTQYYFMSSSYALRFDLHNRWYSQEVLAWSSGVKNRDKSNQTTMFLFGLTYFF